MPRFCLLRDATRVGMAALIVGVTLLALLHVMGPTADISAVHLTISEYGLTSAAWLFNVSVVAVALGTGLILAAAICVRVRLAGISPRRARYASALGVVTVIGLVLVVAFEKTNWAVGPSVGGSIHRLSGAAAFVALPAAIIVVVGRRPRARDVRWARALCCAAPLWLVPVAVAYTRVGAAGQWWTVVPLGLLERGMGMTELAAVTLLAHRTGAMIRAGRRLATPQFREP